MKRFAVLLVLLLVACAPAARHTVSDPDFLRERDPKTTIMYLGVFHFANPGLDAYKPRFPFDALSSARQQEIDVLVDKLAAFRPTRIAVEWQRSDQERLDSLYAAYANGKYSLGPNEVYQLGFRLARKLGQARVYAIDAPARSSLTDSVAAIEAKALGVNIDSVLKNDVWTQRYHSLYEFQDSLKSVMRLTEYLAYLNEREEVRKGHGSYVVGSFKLASGNNYVGVDDMTQWYNRNLRIFSNLQQLSLAPADRILVIIGAGHLPILQFITESSPEHRLVDVRDYLAR